MSDKLNEARQKINEIDSKMAELFVERMKAAELVAEHKMEHGLKILDPAREAEVIRRNSELVTEPVYKEYYVSFQKSTMAISREYQAQLIAGGKTESPEVKNTVSDEALTHTNNIGGNVKAVLDMNLGEDSYRITVGTDLLKNADRYFNLDRNVFIVTDSGVPHKYADTVKALCKKATVYTVDMGEESKSIGTLEKLLVAMCDAELGRHDCVVAIGGGVVGDLSGFAASVYMRGIDFYNVPTTLLSQVDSSIGGKTAVNLGGIKNTVGSFKQPKAVLIDTDTLSTLPERHFSAGLCEAIKMAATCNADLFEAIEKMSTEDIHNNIEAIITEALKIKKQVVEEDVHEGGIRKVLNFGHTLGHCIEAHEGLSGLYHGECVALGMLAVCSGEVRERLIPLLSRHSLPTKYKGDIDCALSYVSHDKKRTSGGIDVVFCNGIGSYEIKNMSIDDFIKTVKIN